MVDELFTRMASRIAVWSGGPGALAAAAAVVLLWALLGPAAGYSGLWQRAVNIGTTIVTLPMRRSTWSRTENRASSSPASDGSSGGGQGWTVPY